MRRHRGRGSPSWLVEVVSETLPEWTTLSPQEQLRLMDIAETLVERVTWEASRGFAVDDYIRGTVTGHAALLVLGLPDPVYPNVSAVVVDPGTITLRGPRSGQIPGTIDSGPLPVLGHTTAHGPVFIAWDVAHEQSMYPAQGHNVILHEFAHKLDAEDGTMDGTPRLADSAQRQQWIAVCDAEYRSMRRGGGSDLIPKYAATSPSEFFAVTTEVFFRRGPQLAEEHAVLYEAFRGYYRQNPEGR